MNAHIDLAGIICTLSLLIGAYCLAVAAFRWACGYLAVALWRAARSEAGDRGGRP